MPGKNDADRFASHLVDHTALAGLHGQEAHRPPGPALGRWATDHGDQGCLLHAVQFGSRLRSWLVGQSFRKSPLQVAFADPRDLAIVPTDGCGRGAHAVAAIEEQEDVDSTPTTWRQGLPSALHLEQLSSILRSQLQTLESRRNLHPPLQILLRSSMQEISRRKS